ncbi:hypothetical protein QSH65_23715 [Escherichia coli]|uniref:hypothetical protein n=1 Tax=Escherichia coli TaxID=562 RepID=UPI0027380BF6|nr:hypothetical protein [Escherichia coli]MDP4349890.1 hypothetical protein [Escherichia coli]MDP4375890.1 hypothetical protein [Escherichia coli]
MKQLITDMTGLIGFGLLAAGVYLYAGLPASLMLSGCLLLLYALVGKRKLTAVCSHQTRIGNLDAHLI